MKKNTLTLLILLMVGLIAGTLIGQLLAPYPVLGFLTRSVELKWLPQADLLFLRYDLELYFRLNLISLAGLALGFWVFRKI